MRCIELKKFLDFPFTLVKKNEFIYFPIPSNSTKTSAKLIQKIAGILSNKTTQLFISTDNESDFNNILQSKVSTTSFYIGVKISILDSDTNSVGALGQFNQYKAKTPQQIILIPEFEFSNNFQLISDSIVQFFNEYKLPFLFINIHGPPDNVKINNLKNIFYSLRLEKLQKKIYLTFSNPYLNEWNIKTFNTFSGMRMAHIDLSNKCTHSCVFCGVWGPDFIENSKKIGGGKLPDSNIEFMNRQMPLETSNKILSQLPETVSLVQFGGVGDPLTHPHWLEIVTNFRDKGIKVEILTNFDGLNENQLKQLHALALPRYTMHLIINLSAATSETYSIVRPRQSKKTFEDILKNLSYLTNLRDINKYGVDLTFLHVINKYNFKEMVEMVEQAHKFGSRVWLKPLETHSDIHNRFSIPTNELGLYSEIRERAINLAEKLKVEISYDSENFLKDVWFE